MGRKLKPGKRGVIAQYLTRNAALRRLQLSLAQFRQLCIFKGIYPREPNRKPKDSSTSNVYYHAKDILYLSHDPIIEKYRYDKVQSKKYHRSLSKRDYTKAKLYLSKKQKPTLHHIVKERYTSFHEALKNLDDALSTIALFASLRVIRGKGIKSEILSDCCNLLDNFYYFVCKTNSLRKVFVSIKGYYFEAEIQGIKILWLVPHQFTQNIPSEVDFKVLSSFLEFYRTLIKFVNYKLFLIESFKMPPDQSKKLHQLGYRFLSFTTLFQNSGKSASITFQEQPTSNLVFSGLTFLISREVPLLNLALIILSGGGKLTWEGEGAPIDKTDSSITHCIVDRPVEYFKPLKELVCEYIQPQWVFDSFNCNLLLPTDDYTVGKALPPHLSPFVDDNAEGYIPEQREKLDDLIKESNISNQIEKSEISTSKTEQIQAIEKAYTQDYEEELKINFNGSFEISNTSIEINNKTRKLDSFNNDETDQNDIDLRKGLLMKKHRRLYDRIQKSKKKKEIKSRKLQDKRTLAENKNH